MRFLLFSRAESAIAVDALKKAWPVCAGILLAVLLNLADMWYIAMLGADELAAVSFAFPVMLGASHGFIGLGTGITTVIARRFGAGETRAARAAALCLPVAALLPALCAAAAGLIWYNGLFTAMGAKQAHLPHIHAYMPLWFGVCLPALALLTACNAALRGAGDTLSPAKFLGLAAIINGVLDPLLIFGPGFFPELGVAGAALASALALGVSAMLSAREVFSRFGAPVKPLLASVIQDIRAALFIGFPAILAQLAPAAAQFYITVTAAGFGAAYVAGYGIGVRTETVFLVFFMGLSVAVNILAAGFAGARDAEGLRDLRRAFFKTALYAGAALTLLLLALSPYLTEATAPDKATARAALLYLHAAPLSLGAAGACMCAAAYLNGLARPYEALGVYLLRCLIFLLPAGAALSAAAGPYGLYHAVNAANAAALLFCLLLLPRYERAIFGAGSPAETA